jgi:hypothetical protein
VVVVASRPTEPKETKNQIENRNWRASDERAILASAANRATYALSNLVRLSTPECHGRPVVTIGFFCSAVFVKMSSVYRGRDGRMIPDSRADGGGVRDIYPRLELEVVCPRCAEDAFVLLWLACNP